MARNASQSPWQGADRLTEPGAIEQARLAWRLLRDPRVSWLKFAIPAFAVLYLVSPIDPIPDFLLGIGQVDDLGVLVAFAIATMRLLPRMAPAHVVAEHRADLVETNAAPAPSSAGPVYDGTYTVRNGQASSARDRGRS